MEVCHRAQADVVFNAISAGTAICHAPDVRVRSEANSVFAPASFGAALPGQPHPRRLRLRRQEPPDYRIPKVNWNGPPKGIRNDGKGPVLTLIRPQPWMIAEDGTLVCFPSDRENRVMSVGGFAVDPGDVSAVFVNGRPASCAPIKSGVAFLADVPLTGTRTPIVLEAVDFAGNRSRPVRFCVVSRQSGARQTTTEGGE